MKDVKDHLVGVTEIRQPLTGGDKILQVLLLLLLLLSSTTTITTTTTTTTDTYTTTTTTTSMVAINAFYILYFVPLHYRDNKNSLVFYFRRGSSVDQPCIRAKCGVSHRDGSCSDWDLYLYRRARSYILCLLFQYSNHIYYHDHLHV